MASAFKTQLETTLAAAIMDFAGASAGATNLDPDLPSGQRLVKATGGFLLLGQDRRAGPLVRLKVLRFAKKTDESGLGDSGRSFMGVANLRVAGVVAASKNLLTVITQRDMLEEVIRANLLKVSLSGAASTATGESKAEYVALLNYLSTDFIEETADAAAPVTDSTEFVAFFTQDWEVQFESWSGV